MKTSIKEKSIIRQAKAILKERDELLVRLSCPTSLDKTSDTGEDLRLKLLGMNLKITKRR